VLEVTVPDDEGQCKYEEDDCADGQMLDQITFHNPPGSRFFLKRLNFAEAAQAFCFPPNRPWGMMSRTRMMMTKPMAFLYCMDR